MKPSTTRGELCLRAAPGSVRYLSAPAFHKHLAESKCSVCGCNGEDGGMWVMTWGGEEMAHMECLEQREARFEIELTNAGRVDAAAKANGLTVEGFRALPKYEQRRLLFRVME